MAGGSLRGVQREFCIDNLLVRVHFIVSMIRWTGLAPWEFEFPFPGSLTSTFLVPNPNPRPPHPNTGGGAMAGGSPRGVQSAKRFPQEQV